MFSFRSPKYRGSVDAGSAPAGIGTPPLMKRRKPPSKQRLTATGAANPPDVVSVSVTWILDPASQRSSGSCSQRHEPTQAN